MALLFSTPPSISCPFPLFSVVVVLIVGAILLNRAQLSLLSMSGMSLSTPPMSMRLFSVLSASLFFFLSSSPLPIFGVIGFGHSFL